MKISKFGLIGFCVSNLVISPAFGQYYPNNSNQGYQNQQQVYCNHPICYYPNQRHQRQRQQVIFQRQEIYRQRYEYKQHPQSVRQQYRQQVQIQCPGRLVQISQTHFQCYSH